MVSRWFLLLLSQLEEVNERLVDYSVWHQQIDCWVMIEVPDPTWVYKWRLQVRF